jgi:hypothetical protein
MTDARRRSLAAAVALLTLLALVRTACAEMSCPDTLSVQQRAEPPTGWSVSYAEQAPRLSGVTIFDGQPANRVSLKYNRRRQTAKEMILGWDLADSPRSYYLQCSYERSTAQIATPLPPGIRTCEVAYDRNVTYPGGGLAIKRMVCR